tara:strand:+ start:241 stop:348 length:108 start_codon:yes stop_codon:yes gene_type:complete
MENTVRYLPFEGGNMAKGKDSRKEKKKPKKDKPIK